MHSENSLRRRYIGDKAFYAMVFSIVLPVIVQNTVANFVNLLDNVMVGRIGTEQMSGVSIANQLMFVFNLCIFGGLSGAGIFTAQYYGARDDDGVRYTMRFKIYTSLFVLCVALIVFGFFAEPIIRLYLTEDSSGDVETTLGYSLRYLRVMMLGLAPFAFSQCYAGTLRETGETVMPMKASIAEVLTNLGLNYILIFGKLGLPALGVVGAAVATVVSRLVGLGILVIYTHRHSERHAFAHGLYHSLYIPGRLVGSIIRKGMPLLANEALWSVGTTMLTQQYSLRGLTVIAALSISSTVSNMFSVVFMSLGTAVAILVGQALGADDVPRAKDTVRKLIVFSLMTCVVFGGLLAAFAPLLPMLYNTTADVRALATKFLWCSAALMLIHSFNHCCYFTLRSGGKTVITFLYDCAFTWLVMLPAAFVLARYTALPVHWVYLLAQGTEGLKCVIGYILVKKGIWIHNIVGSSAAA